MSASVEHLVREVFQDVPKSSRAFEDERQIRSEWYQKHQSAVEEIKYVERRIQDADSQKLERRKVIEEESHPDEDTRSTKQSFTSNLEPELARKYALIEYQDLFPAINLGRDEARINKLARERWKNKQPAAHESVASKSRTDRKTRNSFLKLAKLKNTETSIEKPQKSIIRTEVLKTILVARPAEMEFVNFEKHTIYKRVVEIKNVSNEVAKFQLETRTLSTKFSIVLQSRNGDRENLAPGMSSRMTITFSSEDLEDSEERYVVKVQFGKPIVVVVRAYRDPPILRGMSVGPPLNHIEARSLDIENNASVNETCGSCEYSSEVSSKILGTVSSDTSERNYVHAVKEPSTICGPLSFAHFDCKTCFVGERTVIATTLRNIGGDGRFFAMSEIDWNSMSIDDVTTKNFIILACFAIWPAYFSLKRNEEIEFLAYFFPDSHGVQVDKLYIICDNFAVQPIELIGDGLIYDHDFITIGENAEKVSCFEDRESETCDYSIDLGVAVPSGHLKRTITIGNSSGIEIHYRWEKRCTNEGERRNRVQTWKDFPLDFLTVKPNSGIIRACSSVKFRISASMTNMPGELYRAVLQLILEDIPSAAIRKEYEDRAEISVNKRRCCKQSMDLRAKEIEVWLRCSENINFEPPNSHRPYETSEDQSSELPVRRSISA